MLVGLPVDYPACPWVRTVLFAGDTLPTSLTTLCIESNGLIISLCIVLNHLTLYRVNILSTLIVGAISIAFLQHDIFKNSNACIHV